jgi:hypothetical protein
MKNIIIALASLLVIGNAIAQSAPTQPGNVTAATPVPMVAPTDTNFSAGVTTALNNATTNIVYLDQNGSTPTFSIVQDGNSNRSGASVSGVINPMIMQGDNQVLTIQQSGNGNLINTLQVIGSSAQVQILQNGNLNSVNAICGDSSTNCNGAELNWSFNNSAGGSSAAGNTLNYTGNGTNLISGINITGGGNQITDLQSGNGQQQLLTVTGDNNVFNVTQSSTSAVNSLVLAQNGTGTTFNISQTGLYSNVANVQAGQGAGGQTNGGSITIIQHSH